jgi:hypothetical protein
MSSTNKDNATGSVDIGSMFMKKQGKKQQQKT